ncbi:hypothetical protein [Aeromonas salmonicida]|uniref:hypothetical protein n=1 Tax=Aeromonas salmonicida TaxID=645 RepID=UPI00259DB8F8|nr:hypothetical protein [Aeromonas salmonicida]MDM5151554.1 hypothetical protein [Aeromonas salmonicida]
MEYYHTNFPDDENIRQGDIIINLIGKNGGSHISNITYGVILTADCDIAQDKSRDRYTWLEIIPVEQYIEHYWVQSEIKKIIKKQGRICIEILNPHIKKEHPLLSPLTEKSLCEWLVSNSVEEVICALRYNPQDSILRKLKALLIASRDSESSNLDKLIEIKENLGTNKTAFIATLKEALSGSGDFPDFIFIPEIPAQDHSIGFIILLRNISTLRHHDLYKNEIDARVNGNENGYYRIGRFSDALRFSISQKVVFLFSRIGMESDFEQSCVTAIDLSLSEIIPIERSIK